MATVLVDSDMVTVEIRDTDFDTFDLSTPGDFVELDEILEHEFGLVRTSGWVPVPYGTELIAEVQPLSGTTGARDLV